MFNPLNLFKKKLAVQVGPEELTVEPVAEQRVQIDNIAVHTMPERFRQGTGKKDGAKTTGLLIVGGGVVFLAAASAGLYFYLFKAPSVTVKTEQPAATVNEPSNQSEIPPVTNQNSTNQATSTLTEIATTTEPVISPINTSLATSTASSTPETIEPGLTAGLIPSLDSDSDGLTNAEEILLGTATSTPDTDGDSYLDGAELLNLYDPASSGKLSANPHIALYDNKTYNYSLLYPRSWQISDNGGDDSVMFKSDDNQFFQVVVQPNTAKQTIDQWYMDQLGATTINESSRISGPDWQGIKNLDGLTIYLMDSKQNNIYTLAYNPGENNILDYINLFGMMIKSFTLK